MSEAGPSGKSEDVGDSKPIDLTFFRPEQTGPLRLRFSKRGSVDRAAQSPDAVTVDSELTLVGESIKEISDTGIGLRRTSVRLRLPEIHAAIDSVQGNPEQQIIAAADEIAESMVGYEMETRLDLGKTSDK